MSTRLAAAAARMLDWLTHGPDDLDPDTKTNQNTIVLHRADTRLRDGAGHGHWYHASPGPGGRDEFDAYLPDTLTGAGNDRPAAPKITLTVTYDLAHLDAVPGDRIDGYCGFCGMEGHTTRTCAALAARDTIPHNASWPISVPYACRLDLRCVLDPHPEYINCRDAHGNWIHHAGR